MNRSYFILGFAAVLVAATAHAQYCVGRPIAFPSEPTFLVPLLPERQPGQNNSLWSSEAVVHNPTNDHVRLVYDCVSSACGEDDLAQGTSRTIESIPAAAFFPARFYSVLANGNADATAVAFQLRVFDENAAVRDFGTYVPVPRWDLLKPGRLLFINVPTDAAVRSTLRIFSAGGDAVVHLWFYDQTSGALLAERDAHLNGGVCTAGYLQIGSADIPTTAQRLRIEVQPVVSNSVLWGLLSVTSADNRQITLFPSTTAPLR